MAEHVGSQGASASTSAVKATSTAEVPWHNKLNPLRWGAIPPVPEKPAPSPENEAGLLSKLTFQWTNRLMVTGYKRRLKPNDIWNVNPDRTVSLLADRAKERFLWHVSQDQKHPLFWCLYDTFRFEFWLGGVCALWSAVLRVFAPFTLRFLIQFVADAYAAHAAAKPIPHMGQGIGLTVGITLMLILQTFCTSHNGYHGTMVGGQSKGVLIDMIYQKAMVICTKSKSDDAKGGKPSKKNGQKQLDEKASSNSTSGQSKKAVGSWDNGSIVNLMSVDTLRIDEAAAVFHSTWTAPFACVIGLVVLLINLSYAALPGFGLLVMGLPFLAGIISRLSKRRKSMSIISDQRISLLQEILQSIRFIKLFGWERPYMDRLNELRSKEMNAFQTLLVRRNTVNALSLSLPTFAAMLSIIVFSYSSQELTPAKVFSALALFNALRLPVTQLPIALSKVTDASVSVKRIEKFLLEEELHENATRQSRNGNDSALELHDASFTWEPQTPRTPDNEPCATSDGSTKTIPSTQISERDSDDADDDITLKQEEQPVQLRGLDFHIGQSELVAVIGPVGSGKSSLLAALTGDMRKVGGEVIMRGSLACCSELPWIQNTTLEKNITFGKPMDRKRYEEIIKACALESDLDIFPNGDQTQIGERGINISGGQKQRIDIARAIYSDADIVLMDDPLSAVDAHVGRHIFDHAILGLLKDKCRIFVTHHLWVLNRCDRIIWMDDCANIRHIDTFDNLMEKHADFRAFMETSTVHEEAVPEVTATESKEKPEQPRKKAKKAAPAASDDASDATVYWSTYGAYFRASGCIFNMVLIFFAVVISQGTALITRFWISYWTGDRFNLTKKQYIAIYVGLACLQALTAFLFSLLLAFFGARASRVLHSEAVSQIFRASISFFDMTPLGRITSRFSRDVEVMDNTVSAALRTYLNSLAIIISAFVLIIVSVHYFAASLVLFPIIFAVVAYYRASAREVRRFETLRRLHLSAKFSEGLGGAVYIRAYGLKQHFFQEMRVAIDNMNSAYYLTFANQSWLALRLDLIGSAFFFIACIMIVQLSSRINPSLCGLILTYLLGLVQLLQLSTRQFAAVQGGMGAVQRLQRYSNLLQENDALVEAPLHTVKVRETWPERGEIVFNKVQMRYRKSLPLVLQDLSLHIRGSERIGIVGRTGAGKSSIISALFRLVEISGGNISIDGLDISTIGLHDLRSRLAIIPQDPALFSGTLRSNLDPFNEKTDEELLRALQQADLIPASGPSTQSRLHLDSVVQKGGLNFSLGQRQLMALARALSRGSQIIICDEATSSVDMETDSRIQRTMATAFRGKTLLCIAHRLYTILSYDRICVMDAGRIAELDTPLALWEREDGIFRGMCERSGIRLEDIQNAKDELEDLEVQESCIKE